MPPSLGQHRSGSRREENPFPELGACLHPGCAGNVGSGLRGRGLQPGPRPAGKVTTHGAGESSARVLTVTIMQIYVSGHANEQHLFALVAWALFPGDCSTARALQRQGWGCGARDRVREGSGTEGRAARLPALPHQPDRMGQGLGDRPPPLRACETTRGLGICYLGMSPFFRMTCRCQGASLASS